LVNGVVSLGYHDVLTISIVITRNIHGSSILDIDNGSIIIFKAVEVHPTFKSGTPMPDGSTSSNMIMEPLSISRMEEPWMFLVITIEMVRTSW
jgi:hypothetical protein